MGLAKYQINIPVTYSGITKKGIFKKKIIPYSITFTNDELQTCFTVNARSPSRAYKKVLAMVKNNAENSAKQVKEANEQGTFLILTGRTEKDFQWSKPFYKLDGFSLGTPEIKKIKEWSEASMREIMNSNLTLEEFQEVFKEKKSKEKAE